MPHFLPVAVQILQKMMFLTAHGPDRAVSLETVSAGSNDVCMVLGIADLAAAGFDFHLSRGISRSIKKNPNKQKQKTKQSSDQTVLDRASGLEK